MENRYAGKCTDCGRKVPAGAGTVRKVKGYWLTYCAQHSSAAPVQAREVVLHGQLACLSLPYDAEALPLLRSLPGARWDGDRAAWTACSESQPDAARVLEVAEKLGLAIPDELRARASATISIPRAETPGLYDFQRDGIRFLATHDHALLADEQGLGKTVQALLAIPDGAPVIVVAPACVAYNWRNEAAKWRPEMTARVVRGKAFAAPKSGEIIILSWAALPAEAPELETGTTLIADEAHFAKSFKATRSKRLQALGAKCTNVWMLTGTPLTNRPTDLYSVLQVGGMSALGKWPTFVRLFNGFKGKFGGWEWGPPGPEVAERLKNVMLRRRKSEVLTDLPAKTIVDVVIESSGAINRAMKGIDSELCEEIERGYLPRFEEMAEARRQLAVARIPAAIEFVEQFEESGEPIVVFSAHREPVETLGERDGWAMIHGDVAPEKRTEIVERFQNGELKGVAITIAAGGVGLTLTKATHELFIDLAWNPADNVQAEDRIHRIGQKNAVTIHRMVSDNPLDRRVHELLSKKIALISATLDASAEYDSDAAIDRQRALEDRAKAAREAAEQAEREENRAWLAERESSILGRAGTPVTLEITDAMRLWVCDSMSLMISRCDGARTQDGCGFSRNDACTAHRIFKAGLQSDSHIRLAFAILSRYPRQVGTFAEW